ncbi:pre-mRNA-splicing factor rse1 [Fusarium subglutinans]|uniref:Pre-mRNA-splicing factor rse1 n=1 Tax=Gibberella subglutinans TaxID=42677 RepID=A0A8H5PBN6_GIBSU|nr:pre-mRNA-splicing factor rse1 [Fusarium subglutinans]KAF5593786.1 pre-mRNA-splicing factor rse1 [Fusarium subglutinans]
MAATSNMFLYSLSLQSPTAISQAIVGYFSGTKEQQVLTVSGSILTLHRPEPTLGRVRPFLSHDLFSIIRSVVSFRLAGSSKDYIIVTSDSGCIAVIEYLPTQNRFSRIVLEAFGKSGVRRTVPGEYLAVDPKGRACMLASIEKNKLVYVLNRNSQAEPTISSPLEAHKHGVQVLALVALDVGYSNPVFAALETDYSESDLVSSGQEIPDVELVYYELDLGLNHVVRKWSETVDSTASLLFQVPGGIDGPSGVRVCGKETSWTTEDPQRKRTIVSGVMHKLKNSPEAFFLLLQTDDDDIFKLTFDLQVGDGSLIGELRRIKISIDSLSPLMDCKVADLVGGGTPQIYSVSGSGARSHFRVLKHGLGINEVATSELPGTVSGVWTTKLTRHDKYDGYIILTSSDNTLVMGVGDEVQQVSDSGFLTTVTTLAIQQIGDDGIVQIHARGIRHLRGGEINDWPVPQHRVIVAVATNERQIAVALSSGEIVHFEIGSDGSLADLGPVPEGRLRSPILAVGCEDCTVRILSLHPDSTLESKSIQALIAAPSALNVMAMEDPLLSSSELFLNIGLSSGVYLKTRLDGITGQLSDTQTRFLGLKAIKLFQVTVKGQTCVLALGSKPWMGYTDPKRGLIMTPLDYDELEWAWNFSSEQCGIIAVHANFLHTSITLYLANLIFSIFSIESLSDNMVRKSLPLTYTPRHFVKHPHEPYFYTAEADNNTLGPELRTQLLGASEDKTQKDEKLLPPEEFGYPPGRGRWASCISVVDPIGEQVLQKIELGGNEAALCVAVVLFTGQDGENFLLVGTGKDMILDPRQFSEGYIHVYRFQQNGRGLEFIHKTKLIVSLNAQDNRIVVGDVQHGVTMVTYDHKHHRLIPFVDDTVARWTTCTEVVDYESVVGGDKFGNLWVVRCPEKASQEAKEDGNRFIDARNHLRGAPARFDMVAYFFTQDIPTSITKTNLVVGGLDVIVWSGLHGTIGVLIPFVTREDADFFHKLEVHMRAADPSLVGRDHLMYRGYYVPAKGVIDGDLCERFRLLPVEKKQRIAVELDRTVMEVERKISEARTRSAF